MIGELFSSSFPGGSEVKASACSAGDLGSIPGSGRSPGEGNGNPLQNSCLENPMDGGAWWAIPHRLKRVGYDLSTSLLLLLLQLSSFCNTFCAPGILLGDGGGYQIAMKAILCNS